MYEFGIRRILHEGFLGVWFLGFISSQYTIKEPLRLGRGLLSVVDQGWIEIVGGQGAISRVYKRVLAVQPISRRVPTLLIFVGMEVYIFRFFVGRF